jgi:hypothetical protein
MTCIAALVQDGTIWMGGDSAGTDWDFSLQTGSESKVWLNGPLIFGACGSFRVAQLLRWHLTIPVPDPDGELLEYMTGSLVDAMRDCLTAGGSLTTWQDTATEELTESGLLIGYAGRIFEVYEDFGIGEYVDGFASIGCGSGYALGSLFATPNQKPRKRLLTALKAGERYSGGVRGPFVIEKLS